MRLSRPGSIFLKAVNTRFLLQPTIIIFISSWIERVWAFVKSSGPGSSFSLFFDIIFKLTIVKIKQIQLQIHCLVLHRKNLKKKALTFWASIFQVKPDFYTPNSHLEYPHLIYFHAPVFGSFLSCKYSDFSAFLSFNLPS